MADITQLRYAQLLKRMLGLKATDPGRVVANVVSPCFEIQDMYRPEARAMRGERLFTLNNQITSVAATNIGFLGLVAPLGTRIAIVKRITFSLLLPTSTNQPGNCFFFVQGPNVAADAGASKATLKDGRVGLVAGLSSTGSSVRTTGAMVVTAIFTSSIIFQEVHPGASTVPTVVAFDNVDAVVPPGAELQIGLGSDTLPVASYTYTVSVEGYEYVPDPAELIPGTVV